MRHYRKSIDNSNLPNYKYNYISFPFGLNKDEKKLLDDLIIFNKRLVDLCYSEEDNEEFISMIDKVIEEKLKKVNSSLALKFLNKIWSLQNEDNTSLNVKIIAEFDCDLAVNRLSIRLLDIMTNDKSFLVNYTKCGEKASSFFHNNFFKFINYNGIKANYLFMIDTIERFLGFVISSNKISEDTKIAIIGIYCLLYNDIELELSRVDINRESGIILSNRYEAYRQMHNIDSKSFNYFNVFNSFLLMTDTMLLTKDSAIDDTILEDLELAKLYLDSLLFPLKDDEVKELESYYDIRKNQFNLNECSKSHELIKKSIKEKRHS